MVDRVFNRSPTPGRVQSFLPAVCSAHIHMFAMRVVLLGSWLSGDSFLPLPSVGSPRIFTYFQAVVIVFLFSVEGAPLCLADIICGVECYGLLGFSRNSLRSFRVPEGISQSAEKGTKVYRSRRNRPSVQILQKYLKS